MGLFDETDEEYEEALAEERERIRNKNNSTLGFKPKCCFVCAVLKNTQIIIYGTVVSILPVMVADAPD